MKSVINDLFPSESRAKRRNTLGSESRERLFAAPPPASLRTQSYTPSPIFSPTSQLQDLGKTPQSITCPYCKQTARTRVRRSDSRATKKVNALLWLGLGDPFALSSFDWCQNIDHFCGKCSGHLVRKPYKGELRVICEDDVAETQMRGFPEGIVLAADADYAIPASRVSQDLESQHRTPTESAWEVRQPSIYSFEQAGPTVEDRPGELEQSRAGDTGAPAELSWQETNELGRSSTIMTNPAGLDLPSVPRNPPLLSQSSNNPRGRLFAVALEA